MNHDKKFWNTPDQAAEKAKQILNNIFSRRCALLINFALLFISVYRWYAKKYQCLPITTAVF